jgi:hypothetical protein
MLHAPENPVIPVHVPVIPVHDVPVIPVHVIPVIPVIQTSGAKLT